MQRRVVFLSLILAITVGAMKGALGQSEHGKAISADAVKWGPAPPMVPKGAEIAVVCTENLNPDIVVMKSAKDGA